ncbi:MAG: recombinase family protein [Cyclobacteriaceae bacterium]
MIEKMRAGYWVIAPPKFYKNLNPKSTADKAKLVVTDKGKLIRKAFLMKARKNMTLREIKLRLEKLGLKISEKALGRVFRNPFYCGLITSSLIPGEVIVGHHEPLISQEIFLKVHELMSNNHFGYHIMPQHEPLWLQNFMVCSKCSIPYTGYKRIKPSGKVYYYYKCNTKHCRKNKSAQLINNSFLQFLKKFSIDPKLKEPLMESMKDYFSELHKDHLEDFKVMEGTIKRIEKKIEKLEEKYISGEIEREVYQKFKEKSENEKKSVLEKTQNSKISISNLYKCLENVVEICTNLLEFWVLLDVKRKKRLLEILFPQRTISLKKMNIELRRSIHTSS